jgi:xylulokinase
LAGFVSEFASQNGFYGDTGIAQFDHHFLVAKLHWLQMQERSIWKHTHRVCTLSDYLVWWFTGRFLTEAGLAGMTGLVDIHRLTYRKEAIEMLGLSMERMAPLVRAGSDVGPLRAEIIDEWGLASECRLVMGCLDQYASAIGAGITSAGGVCETTGTVLATVRCSNGFESEPAAGIFQGPGFKSGWYFQMIFSSLSAGILERYRNGLPDRPTFTALDRLAAGISSGADGLRLSRNAVEKNASEIFSGRTAEHSRGHEVRAIMEATARELKRQVAILCGDEWPSSIRSGGGAARSKVWLDIKREIVGCEFERVEFPEPTSLGAAQLAHLATSLDR